MTAIYMDGFDHYGSGTTGTNNMLNGPWATVQSGNIAVPPWGARTGQYCIMGNKFTEFGVLYYNTSFRYVFPAPQTKIYMSFGYSINTLPPFSGLNQLVNFRNAGNGAMLYLLVQPTGALIVTDGTFGGYGGTLNILGSTQGPVIGSNTWHLVEVCYDTAAGTFTVRVDDDNASLTPAITVTGLTLGSVYQMNFLDAKTVPQTSVGPNTSYLDDLFIRNGDGTVNNSWLGDRRVATLFADADTTTAGWTPNFYQKLGLGILNNTAPGSVWAASSSTQALGSGDFTIEGFVRFQSLPTGSNYSTIFSKWNETANDRSYQLLLGGPSYNNSCLRWRTSTDGTVSTVTNVIDYPWTPNLDQWYHIAIVRAAGEDLLFVDGIQLGLPIADTATYHVSAAPWSIGGQVENFSSPVANTTLDGWFDEVRLTSGYARYTANFTPTTVEFPRGVADPQWTQVGLLCGFDSLIKDESSYAVTMGSYQSYQFTPSDGATVGTWSTIGTTKIVPDDNTFITAPFIPATSILTLNALPTNGNTVTVGTKDGVAAAVYTFKTALASAFDVLIDTTVQQTLQNLYNAINAGTGAGTKYGTGTTSNYDVFATQLPAGQMQVTASTPGTVGNSIATSSSGISGGWTGTTLAGGLNIPGPSNFKVQRLPAFTTIVSAVQLTTRAFKSDAGIGSFNSAFVGAHGGVNVGPTHGLTVTPVYYTDVYETDPDTGGPISPTTLVNGALQINRDT